MSYEVISIGPWVLLIVGSLMLLAGAVSQLMGNGTNWPWIWIFGLGTAGIGVYGTAFLEPYGKWMEVVALMVREGSPASYERAFAAVADGKMPPEIQEVALNYAINNPIEGMVGMADEARARGKNQQGEETLEVFQQKVIRQESMAREIRADIETERVLPEQVPFDALPPVAQMELRDAIPPAPRSLEGPSEAPRFPPQMRFRPEMQRPMPRGGER
jgi:hypothetical protein